ncbi:MAG: FAD binding domain-containing protein [Acidimicrobiia bacterium]
MKSFRYARPETIGHAHSLLAEYGPRAQLLAGGTDLLVALRAGSLEPDMVVDLKRAAELAPGVEEVGGALRITANTVMTDVIEHELVRRHFPALVEAATTVGSVAIRNRATLAGNICNASPAADTAPVLLIHMAQVEIVSPSETRLVPLDDFFLGPGETVLEPVDIVAAIHLPIPSHTVGTAFGRMTRRRGVDLATINLSCLVDSNGVTTFAFGAVGPRPFLAQDRTGVLADGGSEEEREAVLRELTGQASPISDVRASAEYRQAMLDVLSRRALEVARARLAAV